MRENISNQAAKILIVDDQTASIQMLSQVADGLGEVFFATSGHSALEIVSKCRPDIVLLDIEMPGIDGYAVCNEIKKDPQLSETAIIFVTVHDGTQHELQTFVQGGVDFLQKPLNIPIARARIKTHLALRLAAKELALTQQNLKSIIHNLPAFIAYWDADLRNVFSNDLVGSWFGMAADLVKGKHLKDVVGTENFDFIEPYVFQALAGGSPSFEMNFLKSDNEIQYGQVMLVSHEKDDKHDGFLMLVTDVTARKNAEAMLYEEKERISVMLNSIGDAVIATDTKGRITFVNPIAEILTGWLGPDAVGEQIETVMPLRDPDENRRLSNPVYLALKERRIVGMALNCVLKQRSGAVIQIEDSAAPIIDHAGDVSGAIIVFHDVSEARALAIKMTHLANHDALTNLPNRMLLQDRTYHAFQQARRNKEKVGMFLLDIDHFKSINDAMGHTVGDEILQEIARRLQRVCCESDTVSRQGGDEFLILTPEVTNTDSLVSTANQILMAVAQPIFIDQKEYNVTASVGISIYPSDSHDMESLYRHADSAMYQAKQEGRNRYRFFSAEIESRLHAKYKLKSDIKNALETEAFHVFFQPKVDALLKKIIGVEALIRWSNNGVAIPPAEFIPFAEETGLIVPIGEYVFSRACREAKRWHEQGYPVVVSINISVIQFENESFFQAIIAILNETDIQRDLVELEITEGVLAKDINQSILALNRLKELGVRISIDDFGTGYSSLSYLKSFPIDVLKIDQSFVRDMLIDRSDAAIVETIIKLGEALGLMLVAEGVETIEQVDALLALGCRFMQGYYYSRPVPADQLERLLKTGLAAKQI